MVYFISDLHLGARYITDKRAHERHVVEFLDSLDDATELYLLGDILDYWFEYRYVVPRGYVRFFGALARLADRGVKISWFTGNHDVWLRDYLSREIGLKVYYHNTVVEIMGRKFLLSHGDDVGRQPFLYRFARFCFYNKFCQWLYAGIHPRWTSPIALGWSNANRTNPKREKVSPAENGCLDNLTDFSRSFAAAHSEVKYFVFGHLHVARKIQLVDDKELVVLGDWIRQDTYATFDGTELLLKKWDKS